MNNILNKILKTLTPDSWRKKSIHRLHLWKDKRDQEILREKILKLYEKKENLASEELDVLNFLRENPIHIFPYKFVQKYKKEDIIVNYDKLKDLRFVLHNEERLYFKRRMSPHAIKSLYLGLQLDQDNDSPHRYLNEDFKVEARDVVIDAGAAEGNFSLNVVKQAQKVVLFECDEDWIEPLNATFEPWKEKVVIINKKVSDKDSQHSISLDSLYTEYGFTLVKADIEGDEGLLLKGLSETFKKNIPLKIVICTYHKKNDFDEFQKHLKEYGFKLAATSGFMIYYYDKPLQEPFLRKAILRGERGSKTYNSQDK